MARILVIEDNALVRAVVREKLKRAGHLVLEAKNRKEGNIACRAAPMDLVLTALSMPDMEGIETIVSFRDQYPDIPIVAITGAGETALISVNTAMRLGAVGALQKPFTPAQLLATVNEALRF